MRLVRMIKEWRYFDDSHNRKRIFEGAIGIIRDTVNDTKAEEPKPISGYTVYFDEDHGVQYIPKGYLEDLIPKDDELTRLVWLRYGDGFTEYINQFREEFYDDNDNLTPQQVVNEFQEFFKDRIIYDSEDMWDIVEASMKLIDWEGFEVPDEHVRIYDAEDNIE